MIGLCLMFQINYVAHVSYSSIDPVVAIYRPDVFYIDEQTARPLYLMCRTDKFPWESK